MSEQRKSKIRRKNIALLFIIVPIFWAPLYFEWVSGVLTYICLAGFFVTALMPWLLKCENCDISAYKGIRKAQSELGMIESQVLFHQYVLGKQCPNCGIERY